MTKKEVKTLSNDELILSLCTMMAHPRILKGIIRDAKVISDELGTRGIIEDPESFYEEWVRRYKL